MRDDIFALVCSLIDDLEDERGPKVTLVRSDVERLLHWVIKGDLREINAYLKGGTRAGDLIQQAIPERNTRDQAMYACCRQAAKGFHASITNDLRRFGAEMRGKALNLSLRGDFERVARMIKSRAR